MRFITSWHNCQQHLKSRYSRLFYFLALLRLNRPIGIFLLLWPTLWALWIANQGTPSIKLLILFIGGVVIMRSAGCVINDIADRDFDQHVERTKHRPLAQKTLSIKEALGLFLGLIFAAFLIVLQFNWLTIKLAILGLCFTSVYPFLKRITHLPQLFLSIVFTWGIPIAFAASLNQVPKETWILFIATLFWVIAYDTIYAMVDRTDDLKIGVKSTAILFGQYDRLMIFILQSIFLLLMMICGYQFQLGKLFMFACFASATLFIYQQKLIYQQIPQQCFKAFTNNHWVGFLIFLGIFCHYQ